MATIILAAAGAAVGNAIGGSVLGVSAMAIGRLAGASLGRMLDQRLLGQGADVVETGRVDRLRLSGAGEGDPVAQVHGRVRVPGQVIWASHLREHVQESGGGGKGTGPSQPEQRSYSYSVSLALALCEGEISHVARVWADARELPRDALAMRVYPGSASQLPDALIEAVEGPGAVPAYRGTAYVVFEDLDLAQFGNRVPQFSFEICRPAQAGDPDAAHDPVHAISGVALLPGSGEYALATTPVALGRDDGGERYVNVNSPSDKTDILASLDDLRGELPACGATSLIVSWFGDDLRCDSCTIRPKVEQAAHDAVVMPWGVAGLGRSQAALVPQDAEGRPVYGGTPTDWSVVEAIRALTDAGKEVMFYPFILMDQLAGNSLPDPYGRDAQPALPWRGRITTSRAAGQVGSPDGTALATAEVDAFFGTAQATDFTIGAPPPEFGAPDRDGLMDLELVPQPVTYSGPDEWSYRRFILHNAALCAAAGGVESFCIGSEMRGLTRIRGADNSFPAVAQLIALAAEVRALLGPEVRISYAADWSEYFGYQPGNGDRFFHLDPLWADANIDFIGIDNYMPLSDWRDGLQHADANWGSIYDLGYLMSNIEGGEGYDWYYHSEEARAAQIRTPITDAGEVEPWVWRYKDLRNWWGQLHHDRVNGVRAATPTAWEPRSKPIRFTEYGCAAIDKGSNQPNKFLDPKSSESQLPRYSNGMRDELMQLQYLRAMNAYWRDPTRNPVSEIYGGRMLDMEHAYVWAWDLRPFPQFPGNQALWSDGANYARGHWLNGRSAGRTLASVIREITRAAGVAECDTERALGYVRGYHAPVGADARAALQPLLLRYGVDAVERDGVLKFISRTGAVTAALDPEKLVRDPALPGTMELARAAESELTGRVRLRFVEAEADHAILAEEAVLHDDATHAVAGSELPLVMTRTEARQTVTRWLAEARSATQTVRFVLPVSLVRLGAGDVVALPAPGGDEGAKALRFRIDRVEHRATSQAIEAVRIEAAHYAPVDFGEGPNGLRIYRAPGVLSAQFLDLPLVRDDQVPHAPWLALTADPWPGDVAVYASDQDAGYAFDRRIAARTPMGTLLTPLPLAPDAVPDRGAPVIVRMQSGTLQSIDDAALLSGGNLCAVGSGDPGGYELIQFRDAELIGPETWRLSWRLRGVRGTGGIRDGAWPAGSVFIPISPGLTQIGLSTEQRGLLRHYRIGPASKPYDSLSYLHAQETFSGVGLRPYAPVHLRVTRAGAGDAQIRWIRCTRLDGDRWDTPEVPLNEERESYLVQVRQGDTVLRETMVDTPAWTYRAAEQAADGLSGLTEIRVAQVSASYGPGRFAAVRVAL